MRFISFSLLCGVQIVHSALMVDLLVNTRIFLLSLTYKCLNIKGIKVMIWTLLRKYCLSVEPV